MAGSPDELVRSILVEDEDASDAWVNVLVPPRPDRELEKLLDLKLKDGPEGFQPGPLDQALLGSVCWFVRRHVPHGAKQALVIQLPRGRHDVAMLIGFAVQVLRLHALSQPHRQGAAEAFAGSVFVSAMDTGVQSRLDEIGLPGTGLQGLAEALRVFRVRADGRLVTPQKATVPYRTERNRMLYHNIRVGYPELRGEADGFAIIDRTSIRNLDTFQRTLDWTDQHEARRWIVVCELGDHEPIDALESAGVGTVVLPVVPEVITTLRENLGTGRPFTALSTNALAWQPRPDVRVEIVEAETLDERLRHSYGMLAQARQIGEDMPPQLVSVARLLAGISRCADRVSAYNQAAVEDHRSRSLRTSVKLLERRGDTFRGGGPWRRFGQTSWARLRDYALQAYEQLVQHEPKYHALINVIDRLLREDHRMAVRVRTSSRAAARSLRGTLGGEHPNWIRSGKVTVEPWSALLPWATSPVTDILVAPPPRYLAPLLFSGEATRRIILTYPSEVQLVARAYEDEATASTQALENFCQKLHISTAPAVAVLCAPSVPATLRSSRVSQPASPSVDLKRALEGARMLADVDEEQEEVPRSSTGRASLFEEAVTLLPVALASGVTWWLEKDAAVETLIGEKYHHRLAHQLQAGDQVIVPRGEGREALFSRLVAAAHRDADVMTLDLLLGRFRRACVEAHRRAGNNWAELTRQLERAGCSATTQARQWADGSTIAPADPEDVKRVAQLAGDTVLSEGWAEVATIARELRGLHQRVGHLISGAMADLASGGGPNLQRIEEELGDRAEVLDEFVIDTVKAVGAASTRPASDSGMIA